MAPSYAAPTASRVVTAPHRGRLRHALPPGYLLRPPLECGSSSSRPSSPPIVQRRLAGDRVVAQGDGAEGQFHTPGIGVDSGPESSGGIWLCARERHSADATAIPVLMSDLKSAAVGL